MIIYFKIIFSLTLIFFLALGYFGYTEYKSFTSSEEYKSSSVLERLIVGSIIFLASSALSIFILSYLYLIFYSTI
jgi:hypothetical protein